MGLTAINRAFHPIPAEYTFFLAIYGPSFKLDDILGYKASLSINVKLV